MFRSRRARPGPRARNAQRPSARSTTPAAPGTCRRDRRRRASSTPASAAAARGGTRRYAHAERWWSPWRL